MKKRRKKKPIKITDALDCEIDFKKRGRKRSTTTSDIVSWESKCGMYKVEQQICLYDSVTRFYAFIMTDNGWRMLQHMKTYRTLKAAVSVLVDHLENPPKKKRIRQHTITRGVL